MTRDGQEALRQLLAALRGAGPGGTDPRPLHAPGAPFRRVEPPGGKSSELSLHSTGQPSPTATARPAAPPQDPPA